MYRFQKTWPTIMSKDMRKANEESQQHLTSSMQIAFWWKKQIACFHVCFLLRSFWICWNATTLWRATFGLQKWFTYLVYKWKRYTVYKRKKIESLSKDLFNIYMCYISMFLFTIIHILWCNIFGSIVNRGNGKGLSEGNISADCLLDVMVKFVYVCMLW